MAARILSYEAVLVTGYVNIVDGWEKLLMIGSERRSGVDRRLKSTMCGIQSRQQRYSVTDYRIVMLLRRDRGRRESGANWGLI